MGLIRAARSAVGGALADQWKEFFYCEAIPADVLVTRGVKRISGRAAGGRGNDNIISQGSVIAVADGQCMIIVDNGQVAELCAEPGEFTYDNSTEPSIFSGKLGESIMATFRNIGRRFTFGGSPPKDQRVYYFNTKEIMGNKYGTPSPVDFRIVDEKIGLDLDAKIRCSGEYSYRVSNPILFYTNVCGNVSDVYRRGEIDSQTKSELITALRPALARISAKGIRPSELPLHEEELCANLNDVLSSKWRDLRGIEMVSFTIPNTSIPEEYKEIMRTAQTRWQQQSVFANNPSMAAAALVQSQANAMETAAGNAGGAMMGFMGMNQAMQAGGMNANALFQMGQQQQAQQQAAAAAPPAANTWKCSCGVDNVGKFCADCGSPKPAPPASDGWTCACGIANTGRFCMDCGTPRPEAPADDGWTCSCGTANTGRFCANCGTAKA